MGKGTSRRRDLAPGETLHPGVAMCQTTLWDSRDDVMGQRQQDHTVAETAQNGYYLNFNLGLEGWLSS